MRPPDEELKRLGASLREIDPSTLAPDPDGALVRWFLGDEGTEVYVWARPERPPHHVQLVFLRISVEWGEQRGLVTGTFKASPSTAGGRYDAYILMEGAQVDAEVCEAALVLLGASAVEAAALAPLVDSLQKAAATRAG